MRYGARAQVTCRSRYAEDSLARGVSRGISQYVILGAGLDSFARRSPQARHVRVFEIDHPATQEWKRRLQPALDGVTFVPVDFTQDSLGGRLGQARFDFAEPALVSWLGVTMYLDRNAIGSTLAVVGGFAAGSEIIVDYMLPAGLRDAEGDSFAEQVGSERRAVRDGGGLRGGGGSGEFSRRRHLGGTRRRRT
jgi:methyltransferase (TIGR00027 family)